MKVTLSSTGFGPYQHTHDWDDKTLMTTPDKTGHQHAVPSIGNITSMSDGHSHYISREEPEPEVESSYDWSHSFDKMIKPGALYRIEFINGSHEYHYALALQQLVDGKPIALKCQHGIIFNWDNIISVKEVYGSVNGAPAQGSGTPR